MCSIALTPPTTLERKAGNMSRLATQHLVLCVVPRIVDIWKYMQRLYILYDALKLVMDTKLDVAVFVVSLLFKGNSEYLCKENS